VTETCHCTPYSNYTQEIWFGVRICVCVFVRVRVVQAVHDFRTVSFHTW